MKRPIIFFLTAAFSIGMASAQEVPQAYNFSLQDCIDYALDHQNTILNAQLDEQTAKAKVRETLGIGMPQVSADATLSHSPQVPVAIIPGEIFGGTGFQAIPFSPANSLSANLSLSQLIFDSSFFLGLKAAKVYQELSAKATKRNQADTREAVSKAYYNVVVNKAYQSTIESAIVRLRESLRQTDLLYKGGFAEMIDVERIKVLLNNSETQEKTIKRVADLNLHLLKYQMGMPIANELLIAESLDNLKKDDQLINADSVNVENRIEYSLMQTQQQLLEYDLKRYKWAYLPTVAAFASHGENGGSDSFKEAITELYPSTIVGLKLSLPIWSSGQRVSRIKQANYALKKNENDMSQLKNSLNLALKQSSITYLNSNDEVENQGRNLKLAKEVARITKIKFTEGVGSSLEVTTAESELKTAENNYYTALYQSMLSKIDLQKAMGLFN